MSADILQRLSTDTILAVTDRRLELLDKLVGAYSVSDLAAERGPLLEQIVKCSEDALATLQMLCVKDSVRPVRLVGDGPLLHEKA